MENIYAIIKKKDSLKKYCYENGYQLEEVISVKNIDKSYVFKFLAKHGLKFSGSDKSYNGYYLKVSKAKKVNKVIGNFFKTFNRGTYITIKLKDSLLRESEMPFSF